MEMKAVTSSSLSHIGHDGTSLRVRFKNGTEYHYDDVPGHVVQRLLGSPSIGRAFHELIKSGGYTYRAVECEPASPDAKEERAHGD